MKIHTNIKSLRKQRRLSQEELALKVGYKDRSSIAKIEAGLIDLPQSKIVAFASALCVSPAELMGISTEPPGNLLPMPPSGISQKLSCISEAEWSRFVLRALINYHDRMTMCDEQDPFNEGLRYALALVESEIQKPER